MYEVDCWVFFVIDMNVVGCWCFLVIDMHDFKSNMYMLMRENQLCVIYLIVKN